MVPLIQPFNGMVDDGLPIELIATGGFQNLVPFKRLEDNLKEDHLCYPLQLYIVGNFKGEVEVLEEFSP